MSTVTLIIKGISYSQAQNGAYALILEEESGERKLPIVIGAFEAQAIAVALEEDLKPPRPLTHDLFKNTLNRFDVHLDYVLIHKLKEGVFYASLICSKDGKEEIIDARTSDAVALAARFGAPIHTYSTILDQAGITFSSLDMNVKKPLHQIRSRSAVRLAHCPQTIVHTQRNSYKRHSRRPFQTKTTKKPRP